VRKRLMIVNSSGVITIIVRRMRAVMIMITMRMKNMLRRKETVTCKRINAVIMSKM
jgi:hypothetical protein